MSGTLSYPVLEVAAGWATAAQETLGVETFDVVTDKGYYDGAQVGDCDDPGITVYMAQPLHTSPLPVTHGRVGDCWPNSR